MAIVHLRIHEAVTLTMLPVRVSITSTDGTTYFPLDRDPIFPTGRAEAVGLHCHHAGRGWFSLDGAAEIELPAEMPLDIRVEAGPRYLPLSTELTLATGRLTIRLALESCPIAEGWISIDSRCHFSDPLATALDGAAEGLHVVQLLATPVDTASPNGKLYRVVHNLHAFSGRQPIWTHSSGTAVVVNTLNVHPVLGKLALLHCHRPIHPLTSGLDDAGDDWSLIDWAEQCHRKKGLVVWVDGGEERPAPGGEGLVAAILGKIDAIEVGPRRKHQPWVRWLAMLWNCGIMLPVVGASGRETNLDVLGSTRTWVQVSNDKSWVEEVRAGRCCAGNAGWLTFSANDAPMGQQWRGTVGETIAWTITNPSAINLENVQIVLNDHVLQKLSLATGATAQGMFHMPLTGGWLAARSLAENVQTSPITLLTGNSAQCQNQRDLDLLSRHLNTLDEWLVEVARFRDARQRDIQRHRIAEALAILALRR